MSERRLGEQPEGLGRPVLDDRKSQEITPARAASPGGERVREKMYERPPVTVEPPRDADGEAHAIAENIRRTRRRMSETLDELEYRLSPDHFKNEVKSTVRETMQDVRHQLDPRRFADDAGRNMLNTIKEHPIPATIAGMSIGYLVVKAGGRSERYESDEEYWRRSYPRGGYRGGYYGEMYESPRVAGRYRSPDARPEEFSTDDYGQDDSIRSRARERAAETREFARDRTAEMQEDVRRTARRVQDRSRETVHDVRERSRDAMYGVRERARHAGNRAREEAIRAENSVETFVYDNPLAAGAIAIGVGALIGGLVPSTRFEDDWMGETRDDVMHRGREIAESTMEHGREAARHVADEAREAARDVADEAKEAARGVAEQTKSEAKHAAKGDSTPSGSSSGL